MADKAAKPSAEELLALVPEHAVAEARRKYAAGIQPDAPAVAQKEAPKRVAAPVAAKAPVK